MGSPDTPTIPEETKRMDEERRKIDGVRDQLAERFPQIGPAEVSGTVSRVYEQFTTARIRDFVPVLVHRGAANQLRRMAPSV